jgi:hypothetical protein
LNNLQSRREKVNRARIYQDVEFKFQQISLVGKSQVLCTMPLNNKLCGCQPKDRQLENGPILRCSS